MYLRESTGTTLDRLHDEIDVPGQETVPVPVGAVKFNLTDAEPTIAVGDREVPATAEGLLAWGSWLGVPSAFQKRVRTEVGPEFEQTLLSSLLVTGGTVASVTLTDDGIQTVLDPGSLVIAPIRLVNIARRVLGTGDAPVERLVNESSTFAFDVRVPEGYDRGIGGDPQSLLDHPVRGSQIKDITAGGLRIELDRKRNLAPSVQPWTYRLFCTNGMGHVVPGARIDARGQTVDEVLAELEATAQRVFSTVEQQIEHFYALRGQPVPNPERALRRIAREQGIPDRSLMRIIDAAASDDMPDDPTMFDLVNLVTNHANDPNMRRDGGRMILENAGGRVVSEHAARCGHCNSRLN